MARGRGADFNPKNRFERIEVAFDDPEGPAPKTRFFKDASRTALATNDSPDVGFEASLNPYRGCEHGCVYCYARPTHEYLGFSSGVDFESKIMVKEDAPELLRTELTSPKWKPQVVAISGVTDPYQPVERTLQITRRCLQVFAEFRNPIATVTKNFLVTRDIDILADLARDNAAAVILSITTLDESLRRAMEPRTTCAERRLAAIEALAKAGVPTGVMIAPVVPGLTDQEIPAILKASAQAGATFAAYTMLRLPHAVAPIFETWLDRHFPNQKAKVLDRIRAMRGGALNDPRFGSRMRGEGFFAEGIRRLFELARRKAGISRRHPELSTAAFRRPAEPQLKLF